MSLMSLKVEIRSRDPDFRKAPKKYNTVVSAPSEVFDYNEKMCQFLDFQGLIPGTRKNYMSWSSKYQLGNPPYYMAHYMAYKFGADIDSSCYREAMAVVSEREKPDGIGHIFGIQEQDAGRDALQVMVSGMDFLANCDENDYDRRHFLESAGWLPIQNPPPIIVRKLGSRPYRTRDSIMANNLLPFMSNDIQNLVNRRITQEIQVRMNCRSHTAGDSRKIPSPEGLEFLPFQIRGIDMAMKSPGGAIIADDMGLGKSLPLDAWILTPTGWTTMGNIKTGDFVIGSDGRPTEVMGVYPQGNLEIFRVRFSDDTTVECSDDHLWSVRTQRNGTEYQVMPLSKIRANLVRIVNGERKCRYYIPMVQPVEFTRRTLSSESVESVDSVAESVDSFYTRGVDGLVSPDDLTCSVKERIALLQGFLDSSDHEPGNGALQFYSDSEQTLMYLTELVRSLGGNAVRFTLGSDARHFETAPGKTTRRGVTLVIPEGIAPFRSESRLARYRKYVEYRPVRGFVSVESVGIKPAQCIRVAAADHLFVTNDYTLTHNTMQGIGIMNVMSDAKRILVICQANMRLKWVQEIEKWKTDLDKTVGMAESTNFPDTDICVINYDILKRNLAALHANTWNLIICDEAHNLKNPESQRTLSVLGNILESKKKEHIWAKPLPLAKGGKIIHLTGTPRPNKVVELWPLLSSTRPDLWGYGKVAKRVFMGRYHPTVKLIRKEVNNRVHVGALQTRDPIRESELNMRLFASGSFIRRLKREIPNLPKKFRTRLEIPVRLTKDDLQALREAEADILEIYNRTRGGDIKTHETNLAGPVINEITRVRPDSPAFYEVARVRHNLGIIKAPYCAKFIIDELIEEQDFAPEKRTKTVVFAHHKDVISIIREEAQKRMKDAFLVYDGSVTPKKKQEMVDRFQTDNKIRAIIISLAGTTGITLTESARMRVVEPDWSPSNMTQTEDRIWRIGQIQESVDIGYMSIAGTLDARIGNTIAAKMESNERTINTIKFKHAQPVKHNRPVEHAQPVKHNRQDVQTAKKQDAMPF